MPKSLRQMTYDDYGVSKHRYRELKAFCQQYDERKRKITYGLGSIRSDGMPHGTTVGHPVESTAIRNSQLLHENEIIEQSAIEANPDIYREIIKSVTEDIPWEWLDVDMGKNQFYAYRRKFFGILHLKR